jgi:hypothetical protein
MWLWEVRKAGSDERLRLLALTKEHAREMAHVVSPCRQLNEYFYDIYSVPLVEWTDAEQRAAAYNQRKVFEETFYDEDWAVKEAMGALAARVGNLGGYFKETPHGMRLYVKQDDVLSQIREAIEERK